MKIDVGFDELDAVLWKMGIEKLVPDPQGPTKIDIILGGEGVSVTPDEIGVTGPHDPITFKGRKVLVYIRDQHAHYDTYKFHVANCNTIQEFQRTDRFNNRYVASTRTDGNFWVRENASKEKLKKMRVCRNCLGCLNYKGYNIGGWSKRGQTKRNQIYAKFSLQEFFEKYGETKVSRPKNPDFLTVPPNTYSSHKGTFSRICRERAQWRCEECDILLEEERARKFLHAHHMNGDKSDNRLANLCALCVECHHKQPGHALPEEARRDFRKWKRKRGVA